MIMIQLKPTLQNCLWNFSLWNQQSEFSEKNIYNKKVKMLNNDWGKGLKFNEKCLTFFVKYLLLGYKTLKTDYS